MKFFALLSLVALASSAPMPEEGIDAPAALPYVAEVEAEAPAAIVYVHEEIAAEEYVDVEDTVAAPVVAYTGYPYAHAYAGYPYGAITYAGLPALAAAAPATETVAEVKSVAAPVAPFAYGYGYPYAFPAYYAHTGCVNSVGSLVPCAL